MKQFEVTVHESTEDGVKGALVRSFKINADSQEDAKEWGIKQVVHLKLGINKGAPVKSRTVMDENGEEIDVQVEGSLLIKATEVLEETSAEKNEETSSTD